MVPEKQESSIAHAKFHKLLKIYNFQKFPSDHVTDITDYRDAIASKNNI